MGVTNELCLSSEGIHHFESLINTGVRWTVVTCFVVARDSKVIIGSFWMFWSAVLKSGSNQEQWDQSHYIKEWLWLSHHYCSWSDAVVSWSCWNLNVTEWLTCCFQFHFQPFIPNGQEKPNMWMWSIRNHLMKPNLHTTSPWIPITLASTTCNRNLLTYIPLWLILSFSW